ncbi:MAG: hypothetical protein NMNS01_01080 [Nitrosomonas sp.]|nr:MAG: hypothetical protein NMNS01_01080 [Nitrosomonas sp.]
MPAPSLAINKPEALTCRLLSRAARQQTRAQYNKRAVIINELINNAALIQVNGPCSSGGGAISQAIAKAP